MKKIIFLPLVASALLYAGGIDTNTVKVEFQGYKTTDMLSTKGSFTQANFSFGKSSETLSSQLKGAKAVLSPKNIDMGDQNGVITTNIVETFFKVLNSQADINVSFEEVVEANNKGVISAKITIADKSDIVPLVYSIENGKFVAKGQLSLSVFPNSAKALKALSDVAPGHKGLSWPVVDITFSADLAK